jgi:predicted SAM-dependent methyltransferase
LPELKLNVGSGSVEIPGYVGIDKKHGGNAYPLCYNDGTPVEDGSADEVLASHILEHFGHREVSTVLHHWADKLKPGGALKLAVPDAQAVCREYLAGKPINVQGYLMGGQTDADDFHRCAFDEETLWELMADAGLERLSRWKSEAQDCAALPISLNWMGFKPLAPIRTLENVAAVVASARYGPSIHHKCAYDAFHELGIHQNLIGGCFWHCNMSEKLAEAIADPDVEYVLALDFDTIFRADDVRELYRIAKTLPDVDAVSAVQQGRGGLGSLFTVLDGDNLVVKQMYAADFDRLATPITTACFGLTLFNAESLRSFPKPWMVGKPAPDGTWGYGCVHPDIDFWLRWRDAGKKLWLANRVIVGHQADVILWPGPDGETLYQDINEYFRQGMPAEAKRC